MATNVTKRQAESVLREVLKKYPDGEARLYAPGFHASGWTVAFEGYYDWPWKFTESQFAKRTLSEKVFIEPVNGWCLGVYPA